jgi:predicted O-methyltransferase YrrM
MVSTRASGVLRRIERMAERRYLPIMGPERGRVLADLVRKLKPRRILEIGTLVGYSTILMGKELSNDAEIVTIEFDQSEAEMAKDNIHDAEIRPAVKVLVGEASEVIPRLDGRFDMVFLDEAKWEYLDHLTLVEGKLNKGSVVVADNAGAYAYSMRDYLEYVRNSGRYESRFIRVGRDGLEVSTKL